MFSRSWFTANACECERNASDFLRERTTEKSEMIEVVCNDRLGKKVRVKCNQEDTIGDLKKLIAAQTGTRWDKIVLKKCWVCGGNKQEEEADPQTEPDMIRSLM
ncbi:hypothetical protein PO909_016564 [Leuciscus waleckii]